MKRRWPWLLASVPAIFAVLVWTSIPYKTLWWRTDAVVTPSGAVYQGPDGEVMVRSDFANESNYAIVRANGIVLSPNRPQLVTPWFVLPKGPSGVLIHPEEEKTQHDPRLTRRGDPWGFVPLWKNPSGKRVDIVGSAPSPKTPNGPRDGLP